MFPSKMSVKLTLISLTAITLLNKKYVLHKNKNKLIPHFIVIQFDFYFTIQN